MQMEQLKKLMVDEVATIFNNINENEIASLVDEIAVAKRVFIYGLGRERLMLQAFAMRLMHLGIDVHMVGDVTTPGIKEGDLFVTSSGTGYLSTVEALLKIVKHSKARTAFMTAHPDSPLPQQAELIIKIPAQTMKDNLESRTSPQPMGALFEQAQLLMLEMVIVLLIEKLGVTESDMEKNHTNLE
ncbi:MAG: SIS domain-containing protein [Firmicutes bacterium]|nr:SIS domain-containing protein [Bacillota bacterium]